MPNPIEMGHIYYDQDERSGGGISANNTEINQSPEEIAAEKEALEKVTDIMAGNTGVHSLDFGGGPGELFNLEKAIQEGIVSRYFARRAKIQRSAGGWADSTGSINYTPPEHVSYAVLKPNRDFEDFQTLYGIQLILDLKDSNSDETGYNEDDRLQHMRFKSSSIKGIAVEENLLSLTPEQFFEKEKRDDITLGIEIIRAMRRLQIPFDNDLQSIAEQIDEQEKTAAEEQGQLAHYVDPKLCQKAADLGAPILIKYYKEKGINTIGDYIISVAQKSKVPLYGFLSEQEFNNLRSEYSYLFEEEHKNNYEQMRHLQDRQEKKEEYEKLDIQKKTFVHDQMDEYFGDRKTCRLLWPRKMSYEEIKSFTANRDNQETE